MTMPRLSEMLTGPKSPTSCQSCGLQLLIDDGDQFARWMEHDEQDRPEPIAVVLCKKCSDMLIEPHPRLYREMDEHEPLPGCMPICVNCPYRDGTRCTHPDLIANGGQGLKVTMPKPTTFHVLASPRSKSGWVTTYHGPVSGCAGLELKIAPTE
jgi:hypothetical protein